MAEDARSRCIDCGRKVLIGDLWRDNRCDDCHKFYETETP